MYVSLEKIWTRFDTLDLNARIVGIYKNQAGNFNLFGSYDEFGSFNSMFIMEYKADGSSYQMHKILNNKNIRLLNSYKCRDGSVLLCGAVCDNYAKYQDYYLCKISKENKIIWEKQWGTDSLEVLLKVIEREDNRILIMGLKGKHPNAVVYLSVMENPSNVDGEKKTEDSNLIYPNPVEDFIDIKRLNISNSLSEKIEILNSNGELILEIPNIEQVDSKICVSHLPAGIYFLRCSNNTLKFIKN